MWSTRQPQPRGPSPFVSSWDIRLDVQGITRIFGLTIAVRGAGFEASGGDLVAVVGPNASGKTTLLRILAGLQRADRGSVRWDPSSPRIAYVGHDTQLFGELTVGETLELGARVGGWAPQATLAILERDGLADRADQLVSSLSSGMRRRVALMRAFASEPQVLIIDEPFTGLDQAATSRVVASIERQRSLGGVVIISAHRSASLPCSPTRLVRLGESSDTVPAP